MAANPKAKTAVVPTTRAACEREMKRHNDGYRAYMAARKTKNAAAAAGNESGVARAQRLMERHRSAYSAYWRAYTRLLALRKEAS